MTSNAASKLKLEIITCKECGGTLENLRKDAKYCSRKCRDASLNRKRKGAIFDIDGTFDPHALDDAAPAWGYATKETHAAFRRNTFKYKTEYVKSSIDWNAPV